MKNFEELSNFIKSNPDWLNKLKPWLKSVHECDYNNDWSIIMYNLFNIPEDEEIYKIICECRGSVVNNKTGEIICAPFVKFWNFGEERADKDIDWKNALFTHKRDGWMCKLIKYNGKVYIFTNGMYLSKTNRGAPVETSIHPEYGFKDIADVYLHCLEADGFNDDGSVLWNNVPNWINELEDGATIMFELESPWNVIHTHLVDQAKLWLIGYRGADGQEHNVFQDVSFIPFDRPKVYDFNSSEELMSEMAKWKTDVEGEGIVVLSIDNDNNFHRVKVKCEDYLRVKYMENCSNISDNGLFKFMLKGEVDDLVAVQPNLLSRVNLIKQKFEEFKTRVSEGAAYVSDLSKTYPTKKELVMFLKENEPSKMSFYISCMNPDTFLERLVNAWKMAKDGFDKMISIGV